MIVKAFLSTAIAVAAVAATNIQELNQAVVETLSQFNKSQTVANLVFSELKTDAEKTLSARMAAYYQKTGKLTEMEVRVPKLSYVYADAKKQPVASVQLEANADMIKVFGRQNLNNIGPVLGEVLQSTLQD